MQTLRYACMFNTYLYIIKYVLNIQLYNLEMSYASRMHVSVYACNIWNSCMIILLDSISNLAKN